MGHSPILKLLPRCRTLLITPVSYHCAARALWRFSIGSRQSGHPPLSQPCRLSIQLSTNSRRKVDGVAQWMSCHGLLYHATGFGKLGANQLHAGPTHTSAANPYFLFITIPGVNSIALHPAAFTTCPAKTRVRSPNKTVLPSIETKLQSVNNAPLSATPRKSNCAAVGG